MTPLSTLLDQAFASVENSARISDGDDAFDNCKTQLRPLFEAMGECASSMDVFIERTQEISKLTGENLMKAPEEYIKMLIALVNLRKIAEEMK